VSSNDWFLRNLTDFLFKASEIRVAELAVNAAELSVNPAKLSVNADEFWFYERFMFLSHVKHILVEF
jgi:hypothetical protein